MRYATCVIFKKIVLLPSMNNPFPINKYLGPAHFCDRVEETKTLTQAMEALRSVTLFSDRRLGKTGLIHHVLHLLENRRKNAFITVYIDIYDTQSEADFIQKLISAVVMAIEKKEANVFKTAQKYFARLKPTLSFDPITNMPELSVEVVDDKEVSQSLSLLFNYINSQKQKVVIAIDEFQQVLYYTSTGLVARLRAYMQEIDNLVFIFSGSKKHMLFNMFTSAKEPLYHTTQMLPLGKIENLAYKKFIIQKLKEQDILIDNEAVDEILNWTFTYTYYTHVLCSRLFDAQIQHIKISDVLEMEAKILNELDQVYYNYKVLLTKVQWSLLKAIGREEELRKPTSTPFLKQYNLGAASTVQRALESLIDSEMVLQRMDEDGQKIYKVYDVFLLRWIQHKYR